MRFSDSTSHRLYWFHAVDLQEFTSIAGFVIPCILLGLLLTGLMIYAVPTGISFLLLGYLGIITLHWFTGPSVLMNYVGLNLYCPRYAGIPTGMTGDLYSLSINLYQDYPSLLLSMSLVLLVGMIGGIILLLPHRVGFLNPR